MHQLLEPGLEMIQGGDVLKASVVEWGSVVSLGRSEPAQDPRQPVIVVVLGELGQGRLRVGEAGKGLAVEHLGLEDVPEGFDLAVGPRRADLRAQMPNAQIAKPLAKEGEDPRHPEDKGLAVVAHQLQRTTAELEAFVQPLQDGLGFVLAQDSQADDESGMVVDQPHDPGLDVVAAPQVDEERAFDVDVPELVGPATFVSRPRLTGNRSAAAAQHAEKLVDVIGTDPVDPAPGHLGCDPLGVPVGVQPDCDDDHIDPTGDSAANPIRSPRFRHQPFDAVGLESGQPAENRAAANAKLPDRALNPLGNCVPNNPHPPPNLSQASPLWWLTWPAILCRKKEETRTFLIVVPTNTSMGIACLVVGRIWHGGTV